MSRERIDSGLHALTATDDRLAWLIIAADYAAIVAIAMVANTVHHPLATLAALPLIAGRQVALLNLVHAAAHYTLFAKRRINDRVDPLISFPILTRVRPYRLFHLLHHRDIARKSPDRFDYLHAQVPPPTASALLRVWRVILRPLLGWEGVRFMSLAIRGAVNSPRAGLTLAAYWLLVMAGFFYAGWLRLFLIYWIVPLVWLYPVFFFWAEMSDHYAVEDEARNQRGAFYAIFIKGHEMYHAVHHRYPRIPFYRVRAASRYLRRRGEHIEESRGVIDFLRILCRPPLTVARSRD
jgi:fatty acid desaturase